MIAQALDEVARGDNDQLARLIIASLGQSRLSFCEVNGEIVVGHRSWDIVQDLDVIESTDAETTRVAQWSNEVAEARAQETFISELQGYCKELEAMVEQVRRLSEMLENLYVWQPTHVGVRELRQSLIEQVIEAIKLRDKLDHPMPIKLTGAEYHKRVLSRLFARQHSVRESHEKDLERNEALQETAAALEIELRRMTNPAQ